MVAGQLNLEESAEVCQECEPDKVQTCERGTNSKFGRMYTVGTSPCCADFKCDPTRCVHIIHDSLESGGYRGEADMRETGKKRLHTVTVYYEDEKGNSRVHRQTHVHADTELCHHRSCTHIHLPKSKLHLKAAMEGVR